MQNLLRVRLYLGNVCFGNTRSPSLGFPYQFHVYAKHAGSRPLREIAAISLPETLLHPGSYHLVSLGVTDLVPPHTMGIHKCSVLSPQTP